METQNRSDLEVEGWLTALGVEWLCQWDVLIFLHRHETSLISAEYIARLLGYPTGEVGEALAHLESRCLVQRSRVNQGVRLYQFVVPAAPHHDEPFRRLAALAVSRTGRLFLARILRRGAPAEQTERHSGSRSEEGRTTWLKAI